MAETAPQPSAVDSNKQQLDSVLQRLLGGALQPKMSLRQPSPQFSEKSMSEEGYNMSAPGGYAEIGVALQNFGSMVHNMTAQHKQNQVRDAMNEWQGLNDAWERAMALAGDPSAPDFQQKAMQMFGKDQWVQTNLDPSNPKNVKRLKNMGKALNFDLLGEDKENVHREGLTRMFKVKDALNKVKQAGQAMVGHKRQQQPPTMLGQHQGQMDPAERTQKFKDILSRFSQHVQMQPPDPKSLESAARLLEARLGKEEAMEYRKQHDEMMQKHFEDSMKAADERQAKALTAMNERQDKALMAHTQLMREMADRADARMWAHMSQVGMDKGFIVDSSGKAKKLNLKDGMDVPENWLSQKDAEAIGTPTASGRNRGEAAGVILGLVPETNKILALDAKKLGPIMGRMSDFRANKIGANDPDYVYLSTLSELTKSAAAMMHLGLRGAASTIVKGNKFLEAFSTGKMTPDNLREGLRAVRMLAEEYREEGIIAPIGSTEWNKRYQESKRAGKQQDDLQQFEVK